MDLYHVLLRGDFQTETIKYQQTQALWSYKELDIDLHIFVWVFSLPSAGCS